MPRAGVPLFRSVAGIVHPIRPVHNGLPVKYFVNLPCRLSGKMPLRDSASDIMPLLPPAEPVDRHRKKTRHQQCHHQNPIRKPHILNYLIFVNIQHPYSLFHPRT